MAPRTGTHVPGQRNLFGKPVGGPLPDALLTPSEKAMQESKGQSKGKSKAKDNVKGKGKSKAKDNVKGTGKRIMPKGAGKGKKRRKSSGKGKGMDWDVRACCLGLVG